MFKCRFGVGVGIGGIYQAGNRLLTHAALCIDIDATQEPRNRSRPILTEGKTVKFETIFDDNLSEQRSLHGVNEQRRENYRQKALKIDG